MNVADTGLNFTTVCTRRIMLSQKVMIPDISCTVEAASFHFPVPAGRVGKELLRIL
jgi:hypothetical protein